MTSDSCARNSSSPRLAKAEAHANQADQLQASGRLDEAIAQYRKALTCSPNFPAAHGNLGVALQAQGKLDEAAASYLKAISLKPDFSDAHYNLGNIFAMQMQFDLAVASYRRATAFKPNFFDAHLNLGNALRLRTQWEEAAASYRTAIALNPNHAEAHNNLGSVFQAQGKLGEAVACYRKTLALKPSHVKALYNLGYALQVQGNSGEAIACYRAALSLKPDFAEAHFSLGGAMRELGQMTDAEDCYRNAVKFKPDYAEAHNNLGSVLQELHHITGAEACYRSALKIKPDYAQAHSNLGFVLLLTGQFREGWKEYWWRIPMQARLNYLTRALPDRPPLPRSPEYLLPADLHGMRLTLLKEQGLGDELFFLRFAGELRKRGAWVAYVAEPRMLPFLHRAQWVDSVTEENSGVENSQAALLISDLPMMLGMTGADDIPPPVPLRVLPEKRQEIVRRLARTGIAPPPLIGITWRAGTDTPKAGNKNLFKEIPPARLAAALRGVHATFVIVQRNPQPGEIAAFEAALGQTVLDFSELNNDLEGMLALMELLDDYIGVSNTNMHLRASVGKTAQVLVPHLLDFRWMNAGGSSPWFPGFSIYRRTSDDNWDGALQQLTEHYHEHPKS